MNRIAFIAALVMLAVSRKALAQQPDSRRGHIWIQGASVTFTTVFDSSRLPDNQLMYQQQAMPPYLADGNSNICDTSGNLLLVSDGYRVYDRNLKVMDGGGLVVPLRISRLYQFSPI